MQLSDTNRCLRRHENHIELKYHEQIEFKIITTTMVIKPDELRQSPRTAEIKHSVSDLIKAVEIYHRKIELQKESAIGQIVSEHAAR